VRAGAGVNTIDGGPSARALDAMQSSNADILDLQLVKLP